MLTPIEVEITDITTTVTLQQQIVQIFYQYHQSYFNLSVDDKSRVSLMINQNKLDLKIPIKYKQTEYIKPQTPDCAICGVIYNSDDRIVECSQCHQHLHATCSLEWNFTRIQSQSCATCPFCRDAWKDSGKLHYPQLVTPISV